MPSDILKLILAALIGATVTLVIESVKRTRRGRDYKQQFAAEYSALLTAARDVFNGKRDWRNALQTHVARVLACYAVSDFIVMAGDDEWSRQLLLDRFATLSAFDHDLKDPDSGGELIDSYLHALLSDGALSTLILNSRWRKPPSTARFVEMLDGGWREVHWYELGKRRRLRRENEKALAWALKVAGQAERERQDGTPGQSGG